MLDLKKVTLFTLYVPWDKSQISSDDLQDGEKEKVLDNGVEETIRALYTCLESAEFGSTCFITSKEVIKERGAELLKDGIICKEPSIPINNMKDYARYMIYHLHEHVDTEFVLTVQHDGFIINPLAWTDEFFDYDYVGAPWPWREQGFVTPFGEHIAVGNGGFSLRSRRLMQAVEPLLTQQDFLLPEDVVICRKYRRQLERDVAIKFAPVSVAEKFSQELSVCNHPTFGFHGYTLLSLVYRHNLEFLFQHLPPSKNKNKFNEFKAGCKALGIDETGHNGFLKWCAESCVQQSTQNHLNFR